MMDYPKKLDKDNNSVVIDIKTSCTAEKYFCSYCNTRLTPLTQEDMKGGYVCIKCTIEYWPKQQPVKKQSKFDLPGPPTDSHGNVIGDNDIPIAVIDDVNKAVSSTTYKQQKLSPSFEALEKAGFKITCYDEREIKWLREYLVQFIAILAFASVACGSKDKRVTPIPPVSIALNIASDFLRLGILVF